MISGVLVFDCCDGCRLDDVVVVVEEEVFPTGEDSVIICTGEVEDGVWRARFGEDD